MSDRSLITAERLREVLDYDPETGVFTWRARRDNSHMKKGDIAGTLCGPNGKQYIAIWVDMKPYKAHRLAWLYMTGAWPKDQIDHMNKCRLDNRFLNLREATNSTNQHNTTRRKDNSSGHKGVSPAPRARWRARIFIGKKSIFLGYFDRLEDAVNARRQAADKFHGEFVSHG